MGPKNYLSLVFDYFNYFFPMVEEEGLCLSTQGLVMVAKPQYGRFEGGGLGNVNCQLT